MSRLIQAVGSTFALFAAVNSVFAFSLAGPFDSYQTANLGYNPFNTDIAGPMNVGEGYRWNVKTIYYGFTPSFARYFGQRGMQEVDKAFAILNSLPPMSKLSQDLREFPTDTRRVNQRAAALRILDLKSAALAMTLEELGLICPERYVWTLHGSADVAGTTYYVVVQRNFDPVTYFYSRYVNDTLYTYDIEFFTQPDYTDAIEQPVDPLAMTYTAVVSWGDLYSPYVGAGVFFPGLSRDDVASLRYLYEQSFKDSGKKYYNTYMENLPINAATNSASGGGGSPWTPVGTGGALIGTALRPGVDKIVFKKAPSDSSGYGSFISLTNTYKDSYVTNSHLRKQSVGRAVPMPDIVFDAGDLGVNGPIPTPVLATRSDSSGWINNSAIQSLPYVGFTTAGPGQIDPGVSVITIAFSTAGPFIVNATGGNITALDEANNAGVGFVWGSYDGTTNAPVVYPIGHSVDELELDALGGP